MEIRASMEKGGQTYRVYRPRSPLHFIAIPGAARRRYVSYIRPRPNHRTPAPSPSRIRLSPARAAVRSVTLACGEHAFGQHS